MTIYIYLYSYPQDVLWSISKLRGLSCGTVHTISIVLLLSNMEYIKVTHWYFKRFITSNLPHIWLYNIMGLYFQI